MPFKFVASKEGGLKMVEIFTRQDGDDVLIMAKIGANEQIVAWFCPEGVLHLESGTNTDLGFDDLEDEQAPFTEDQDEYVRVERE